MRYKLKLRNAESMIFNEGSDDIRRDHSDDYFAMNYIIQYIPASEINGLILKENEIKEFEMNFSIDVFVGNDDDDEIAGIVAYFTTLCQITVSNNELQVNVKPFTFEETITASNLTNYDSEIDDETFIKAIKDLLRGVDLNATTVKQFMQKAVLSFAQLDD